MLSIPLVLMVKRVDLFDQATDQSVSLLLSGHPAKAAPERRRPSPLPHTFLTRLAHEMCVGMSVSMFGLAKLGIDPLLRKMAGGPNHEACG